MSYISFIPKDPGNLKKFLEEKAVDIAKAFKKGFAHGADLFLSEVIEQQMSGRPGLNRITGNAAAGWVHREDYSAVIKGRSDIDQKIIQTMPYVKFHERGTFNGEKFAPKMPKRLHVRAFFKTEGVKIYRMEIANSLRGMK
jgi:hypothetical protein